MCDGIINILKPTGMTSHDAVARARKILGIKKIGHTGTLDPNVAGVMILTVGKATKLTEILQASYKKYRCNMVFGKRTDSSDTYGKVINYGARTDFSMDELSLVFNSFIGQSTQIPSQFSAVKVGGKKLYNIARSGKEIPDIPQRNIFIKEITILDFKDGEVTFDVTCSKGTYIRVLVDDIAKKLDTYAYVSWLIRIGLGDFEITKSKLIDEITKEDIISLEELNINDAKKVILDDYMLKRFVNGLKVTVTYLKKFDYSKSGYYKVYDSKNNLVSIAQLVDGDLKNKVFLYR